MEFHLLLLTSSASSILHPPYSILLPMSGHSKWSQIKHQKAITDKKRGLLFSKLVAAISAAARQESDPTLNPRLKTCIEKAKQFNVPADKISNALERARGDSEVMEEILLEAYGPAGVAMIIEATTDNRNRTILEIKKILTDWEGKWAMEGSCIWAFEKIVGDQGKAWQPKFPQEISDSDSQKLSELMEALDDHPDVQEIYTNTHPA